MNVRQAIPANAPWLSSLCMDVQRLHAQHHPDIFKVPESEVFAVSFFEEMLADPAVTVFIAEEDGIPVGYVLCRLIERAENPFRLAMRFLDIDQISVRPAVQGTGVGSALMKEAEGLATKLNVHRIHLNSWSFNTHAHKFFEKMKFEKFNHRFWKSL
jgi:GNAT superfamily N-acetyltransferase